MTTLAFILAGLLYLCGCVCMAIIMAAFICLGGRPPRRGEVLFTLAMVFGWPITLPTTLIKRFF